MNAYLIRNLLTAEGKKLMLYTEGNRIVFDHGNILSLL